MLNMLVTNKQTYDAALQTLSYNWNDCGVLIQNNDLKSSIKNESTYGETGSPYCTGHSRLKTDST